MMDLEEKPRAPSTEPSEILPASPVPLTVEYARRTLRVHQVTETELLNIASFGNSIHQSFFGLSFGSLVTLASVLVTVKMNDPVTNATFVGLTWISAVFSLYFGARAALDYKASRAKLKEITRNL